MLFIKIDKIKELGIEFPQNYRFLEVLEKHENIIQKDFADRFRINQSTVTRSLNALEESGFIKREYNDDNKKNKIIKLTTKGKDTLNTIHELEKELEDKLFENIPKNQIETFKETLDMIAENSKSLSDNEK